jgi:hypothetical protein
MAVGAIFVLVAIVIALTAEREKPSADLASFAQQCATDWNADATRLHVYLNGAAQREVGSFAGPVGILVTQYEGPPLNDIGLGGGGAVAPGDCLIVAPGNSLFARHDGRWFATTAIITRQFGDYAAGLDAADVNAVVNAGVAGMDSDTTDDGIILEVDGRATPAANRRADASQAASNAHPGDNPSDASESQAQPGAEARGDCGTVSHGGMKLAVRVLGDPVACAEATRTIASFLGRRDAPASGWECSAASQVACRRGNAVIIGEFQQPG